MAYHWDPSQDQVGVPDGSRKVTHMQEKAEPVVEEGVEERMQFEEAEARAVRQLDPLKLGDL